MSMQKTQIVNQSLLELMSGYQSARFKLHIKYQFHPKPGTKRDPKILSVQFSSVAQSCPTLCDPMDCSTPGLSVHHQPLESPKPMSTESVMPSNHLILCHPLLLLPSIFPSVRVFSNESTLRIRWPKYWSFSFNISPSNVWVP